MEVLEYLTWTNFMNILCALKETLVNFIFNFIKHFKILFETGHECHNYSDSIWNQSGNVYKVTMYLLQPFT